MNSPYRWRYGTAKAGGREKWRLAILAVGFAVLCGTLTACLDTTPATIKFGLLAPFEGADRTTGYDALAGVRLALHEHNQSSSGYRIELVALDDHRDASGQTAAQRAAELVADPGVVAVIGGFGNGPASGAAPVLADAGVPFVMAAATDEDLPMTGAIRLSPGDDAIARHVLNWATAWNVNRWYVVGQNGLADAMRRDLAAEGLSTVGDERDAEIVVYAGTAVVEAASLLGNLPGDGSGPIFVGGPALDRPRFAQLLGPLGAGAYYVSLARPADEPFASAFRTAVGAPPSSAARLAYDAARFILDSWDRRSPPTRAALLQALKQRGAGQTDSTVSPTLYRLDGAGYPGEQITTKPRW